MDQSIVLDFHRDAERVQKGLYQNMTDAKQKGIGNDRADSKSSLQRFNMPTDSKYLQNKWSSNIATLLHFLNSSCLIYRKFLYFN